LVKRNYREVLPSEVLPEPVAKKRLLCEVDPEKFPLNNHEVIEMFFPFVRKHYTSLNEGKCDFYHHTSHIFTLIQFKIHQVGQKLIFPKQFFTLGLSSQENRPQLIPRGRKEKCSGLIC